jgi:hypothetical protein
MKKKIFFKTVNLIFIVIFLSKNSPKNYITKIKKEKRKKKKEKGGPIYLFSWTFRD